MGQTFVKFTFENYGKKWLLTGNPVSLGDDMYGRPIIDTELANLSEDVFYRLYSNKNISWKIREKFNERADIFFNNCKGILLSKIPLCSEDRKVLEMLEAIRKNNSLVFHGKLLDRPGKLLRRNKQVIAYTDLKTLAYNV